MACTDGEIVRTGTASTSDSLCPVLLVLVVSDLQSTVLTIDHRSYDHKMMNVNGTMFKI